MRRLRAALRGESGVTLVEVMIVTALFGLILTFTLKSVATFERTATGGIRRLENLDEARVLMQVITKDVRTAARLSATTSPFLEADDESVTFYANLNLSTFCPKRIELSVDGNDQLIESVTQPNDGDTPPNCEYTEHSPSTRLVGQFIANGPEQPIFTYFYDDGGTLIPFTPDETPLSAEAMLLVSAVEVQLAIRKDTSLAVDYTTLINRVRLPNVFYNPQPTPSPSGETGP
ncbi:MAG TPA: type II secretion system protein [Actinomycetota bacterium]